MYFYTLSFTDYHTTVISKIIKIKLSLNERITADHRCWALQPACFEWCRETTVHLNIQIYQNEWTIPARLTSHSSSWSQLKSPSLHRDVWTHVCCFCRWMAFLCTQCSIQRWWRPSRQEEMRPECWWWILRQKPSSEAVMSFQPRIISQVQA